MSIRWRLHILGLVTVITTLIAIRFVHQASKPLLDTGNHSYRGSDHPSSWDIPLDPVHVTLDDSVRYDIDTSQGKADWKSLLPPLHGAIRLGADKRLFGLSLFHELACVDAIRAALVTKKGEPHEQPHVQHCMDYLRQTVLCRGDITLQNLRRIDAHVTDWFTTYECKDWNAVYEAVASNQFMNG